MITAARAVPSIQKYELLEEIGHGGMATVYRAHDQRLQRDVAIKLIHRHLRENQEVSARFVSEAQAVAKLRHRNIVQVFDVSGDDTDERYLVVELVRGASLRELLDQHHPMPPEIAAGVALEVASALAHAHENGVIHRDIKPENVLVELPGHEEAGVVPSIKLTDFGIAKILDAQGITSTGQVLGSPAHMAPEQIEGGEVTVRADVFGLGVLLYECMVGHLPFVGNNPAQVLRRVLEGEHPEAVSVRATVGARWSAILEKAISVAPEERFVSIEEFASAIRGELDALDAGDAMTAFGNYLASPEEEAGRLADMLVPCLLARGAEARESGDFSLANAEYNRALAYKPGDPDILSAVGALARGRRYHQIAKRGLLGAGLIGGAVALWFGFSALFSPEISDVSSQPGRPLTQPEPPLAVTRKTAPSPLPSATETVAERPRARAPKLRSRPAVKRVPRPATPGVRSVRVHIAGPGGRLLIDGAPKQWFARRHKLSVGPHDFEFLPPNAECCTGEKKRVDVGPGKEELRIVGRISYREAVLSAPSGVGRMICPTLFPGSMAVPGERRINMSHPSVSARCELQAEPGTRPFPAKALEVTLRPGQRTQVNWR